jgi:hypothetical protein
MAWTGSIWLRIGTNGGLLWNVEAPAFSRQSTHILLSGCQPYAPAGRPHFTPMTPPWRFLVLISVRGWTGRLRGRSSSTGRVKNFLFSTSSIPAAGSTQPPIQLVPRALSPGLQRPGHEADHSPPTSAEVKKMWSYTSSPPQTPSWRSA